MFHMPSSQAQDVQTRWLTLVGADVGAVREARGALRQPEARTSVAIPQDACTMRVQSLKLKAWCYCVECAVWAYGYL